MINKINKLIHNKNSLFLKFLFKLRYVGGIFFISMVLFLLIPNLLDYKKKEAVISNYLLKNYGIELNSIKSIDYKVLPTPNLEVTGVVANLNITSQIIKTKKVRLFIPLKNIYNFESFEIKSIILEDSELDISLSKLKNFYEFFKDLNKRIIFRNLKLKINDGNNKLLDVSNINFSNHGFKKDRLIGEVFNRKFKIIIKDNFDLINILLTDVGLSATIDINKTSVVTPISGNVKVKLIQTNLKFNFEYDNEKIKITEAYFRNKNLSFDNKSVINYNPFFNIDSDYFIKEINSKIFENLDVNKLLGFKDLIKKINSNNQINYKSKKFSTNLIDKLKVNLNFTYGRLTFLKNFSISKSNFICKGNVNLLDEYPIVFFDCFLDTKNKKKLLKTFLTKSIQSDKILQLKVIGRLNLLNNKIYFSSIQIGEDKKLKDKDLNYLKEVFEQILFDKDFIGIFDFNKIKLFITEIS
tara:strand:- start:331 stop:1734 length:1404 start_codon:yes stop_codon:yes gene_type:complete